VRELTSCLGSFGVEGFRSHTIRHTHRWQNSSEGVQLVIEPATYTKYNKHKTRMTITLARLGPTTPTMRGRRTTL